MDIWVEISILGITFCSLGQSLITGTRVSCGIAYHSLRHILPRVSVYTQWYRTKFYASNPSSSYPQ